MTSANSTLDRLRTRRPEWQPWLAVVEEVLREAESATWEAAVPGRVNSSHPEMPLLAGAQMSVQESAVRHFLDRLLRRPLHGTAKLATVRAAMRRESDMLALLTASLSQDTDRVNAIAAASDADAEALNAVVALLCVPLLQACNRRWASAVSSSWEQGYCPLCGSWPSFAEVRGIERSRCFRCGRCGSAWRARALHCPYCRTGDHHQQVELVPEQSAVNAVINACLRCTGFVKSLTVLQGYAPGAVMLQDLATVDLDVAAIEQGYVRPAGAGYPLDATVTG